MIAFFRNILSSKLVLGLFALIMMAFIVTGVGTGSGGLENLASSANRVAKVGSISIEANEAARSIQNQFDAAREQQPTLNIEAFIGDGSVDRVIDQMINSRAFEVFGSNQDIVASERLVGSELAGIQAFRGNTGQFDRDTMLGVLQQRGLTEKALRDDITRSKVASMMLVPAGGAARVPTGIVAPFAGLMLETREGQIASIPNSAFAGGAAPSDAELQQFYTRSIARYTVPETRKIRYALFDRSRFADKAKATDVQIAEAYKKRGKEFAGKQTRVFTQVVVPDQKTADAIAAKVRGGASLADAAKGTSGEATTLAPQEESGYAGLSSAAISKAAFAAKQGDVITPGKSALGWHVVRVDSVKTIAGQSVESVRPALATEIERVNAERLLADFVTEIDDAVADGATFDDVVKKFGLTATTTPDLTAGGVASGDPAYKAPAELVTVIKDAFQSEMDDDPAVLSLAAGQKDAFYDLASVTPASPKPLNAIKAQVIEDFRVDRAGRAAKKMADSIAAKISTGTPIAQALSSAGVALPPLRPMAARRIDVLQLQGKAPEALTLLFSMQGRGAKVLQSEDKKGWYVIQLSRVIPGNVTTQPELVEATRAQLTQVVGEEYVAQLLNAIKADIGVSRNADAIAGIKRRLTGGGSSQ